LALNLVLGRTKMLSWLRKLRDYLMVPAVVTEPRKPVTVPIVVISTDNGDVMIFETVEKACRYMEPIDVRGGEYIVFDTDGYKLETAATEPVTTILGRTMHPDPAMLETLLQKYAARMNIALPHHSYVPSALITRLVSKQGYAR
jgi:hypothetical protein